MNLKEPVLVDARGHRCPVPTLRLRRTLASVAPGQTIRLLADDLIASGIDAETPCVAVSKASTADERVHRTTLKQLEDEAIGPAPVLMLIGYAIR